MQKTVAIIAIDSPLSKHKVSTWIEPCLKSWEYWCGENNAELLVIDQLTDGVHHPKWMKTRVFDFVSGGKVALVDSDTMVRWNCPDFFELYDDEFCGVEDNGNLRWLHSSISAYQRFWPSVRLDTGRYINSGVLLFSDRYELFLGRIRSFYEANKSELERWSVPNSGLDQTVINFFLQQEQIDLKLFPDQYNQFGLTSRNLLGHNWQTGDTTNWFIKTGYIWHFTGLPIEQRAALMNQTWDVIKEFYR